MAYVIAWTCAEYVRVQLARAYFLDLLDDGEDAPCVGVVGCVTTQWKRRADIDVVWRV